MSIVWFILGALFLGSPLGLALHALLSKRIYARGVAEGRRLTQIEFGWHEPLSDTSTLLLLRRSPNEKPDAFVSRASALPHFRPVLDDRF